MPTCSEANVSLKRRAHTANADIALHCQTSRSDVFRGPSHLCKLQKRRTYSSQNSSSYIVSYWRENNSQILLWTTFALCLGVFGYQKWAEEQFRKHKNEKPMLFIAENFVLNLSNLRAGRWWTLITYSFTHFNGIHLVFNGVGLVNFGPVVVSYFGASGFVVCWVGSALAAGAASLLWEKTRKSGPTVTGAVGASGSLFGFLTMLAFHTPMAEVGMMYIPISFPIWSSMAVTAGVSITALALSWFPHLGHAGHLGGMTFGALYYFLRRRGKTIHIPRF
ncbi:hypothetical protein MMC07_004462 [Pseudocyphellaria aurata]|nr:hypothetical protein [Pseudocyphellaria aurata]